MRSALAMAMMVAVAAAHAEAPPRELVFHEEIEIVDRAVGAWPVAEGQSVVVRFRAGELELAASAAPEVAASLTVECPELSEERCDRYRERARLEVRSDGETVRVGLTGVPLWRMRRLRLHGRIRYPADAPLELSMGAGAAEVRAGSEDLSARLRIGELVVRVAPEAVGSVAMSVGIGDVSIGDVDAAEGAAASVVSVDGSRRRLVGSRLEWNEGRGDARVEVRMSIGAATVLIGEALPESAVSRDAGGRIGD